MTITNKILCAFLIALLVPGRAQAMEEKQSCQIEKVIKGIIAADNEGDLERILTFYAPDAVLIPPSGQNISELADIRENYEGIFAVSDLTITNEIWETIISGPLASSTGANCVTATSKIDGSRETAYSKYLMILRIAEGGQWKISRLIWANQPAKELGGENLLHCVPSEGD